MEISTLLYSKLNVRQMKKLQISATVEPSLVNAIATQAKKEDRSFSQMVEIILKRDEATSKLLKPKK